MVLLRLHSEANQFALDQSEVGCTGLDAGRAEHAPVQATEVDTVRPVFTVLWRALLSILVGGEAGGKPVGMEEQESVGGTRFFLTFTPAPVILIPGR